MAFISLDRCAPLRLPFFLSPGRMIAAVVEFRQQQANERLANYLRGLPDGAIRKIGMSPIEMDKLRQGERLQPPGLYGRVSVISALRSARH